LRRQREPSDEDALPKLIPPTDDQLASKETSAGAWASKEYSPTRAKTNLPEASAQQDNVQSASQQSPTKAPPSGEEPCYDKRMPPPPVNWQKTPKKQPMRQRDPTRSGFKTEMELEMMVSDALEAERMRRRFDMDKEISTLVRDAQKSDAPVAKGSWLTGKKDQLNLDEIEAQSDSDEDEDEMIIMKSYVRSDKDQGKLEEGWMQVEDEPSAQISTDGQKREREEDPENPENLVKKRKIKSEVVPASRTAWKPSWLETTQCYPVDQFGQDMSHVEALWGDEIHRNTERMRRLLERECMYITTRTADDLIDIARDTVRLCRRPQQFLARFPNKVRVERHTYQ
jgi:hypothetical protein